MVLQSFRLGVFVLWGIVLAYLAHRIALFILPVLLSPEPSRHERARPSAQATLGAQLLRVYLARANGKTARARLREVGAAYLAKWSVLRATLLMLLLIAPPIFFWSIFLPCWECYDFEAAATHEVGHVLGLGHPDQAESPGTNVYHAHLSAAGATAALHAGGGLGAGGGVQFCRDAWAGVVEGVPVDTPAGSVRPSIMRAFTQHNPTVCLYQDDLEALQVTASPHISRPRPRVAASHGDTACGAGALSRLLAAAHPSDLLQDAPQHRVGALRSAAPLPGERSNQRKRSNHLAGSNVTT